MGEKRGMKALELWCKRVTDGYSGVKVENMTTSWRDGLAFCALIHHFRPDLIDFASLKKGNVYSNNELAFRTAERHLGIPALLDAEDMVEYEVPDRLSILTYLSQFYQTFASHPSSPVKRSPDSPDHSLVLSPSVSTPPPKEARRREPCFVCSLPVFLAQRLHVGSHLYHRTCFRCARCSAQLTLANSYETQDGAYCCETCPDEEMVPQDIGDKGGGPPTSPLYIQHEHTPRTAEQSASDDKTDPLVISRTVSLVGLRRMMFENISNTDDEKLPSLRKLSDQTEHIKPSDPLHEQPNDIKLGDKGTAEFGRNCSHRLSDSRLSSVKSSFGSNRNNKPVCLIQNCSDKKSDEIVIKCEAVESDLGSTSLSHQRSPLGNIIISGDNIKQNNNIEGQNGCEFSSLNTTANPVIVETEKISIDCYVKLDEDHDLEQSCSSNDISLVQANNNLITNSDSKSFGSKESIDVYMEETKNTLFEEKEHSWLSPENVKIETETKAIPEVEAVNPFIAKETIREEIKTVQSDTTEAVSTFYLQENVDIEPLTDDEVSGKQDINIEEPEDEFTSLTSNIEKLVIDASNDHVSLEFDVKTRQTENKTSISHKVPTPLEETVMHKPLTPQRRKLYKAPEKLILPKVVDEYPEDLNPFGEDNEKEPVSKDKPSNSTNPFGSSDDDDSEPVKQEVVDKPKPAQRKVVPVPKISLNPFSDDEDDGQESPTPTSRNVWTPGPTPEVSPQPRRLRPACGNLGSSTSIASRKKKPAPLPPNLQNLPTGSRKSYSAPHPPSLSRTVTPSPPPLPASSPPSSPREVEDKEYFKHLRRDSIVSDTSSVGTIGSYTPHKSMYGQWKRKKGPAPPLPVPIKRNVELISLSAIRQELGDIEVKQQGLERQGVRLEQTIRENFQQAEGSSLTPHVEEMVLQLFELVNEKNELFRRQAELMYMRRQNNLEVEHAELEYQIRCLMLCPERNKTDSDKAREEQLIQRLVEVVEKRNEIIDCLEMDRLREKEEDDSVGMQLDIFSAAVGNEVDLRIKSEKKSKKVKKEKRWSTKEANKSVDEVGEKKKSKKKWFILHHTANKS